MPKYYCDYCDAYLTHDSPSVRKTHNGGRKHKENVKNFYQKFLEEYNLKMMEAQAKTFQKRVPGAVVQTAPFPIQPMRLYCLVRNTY
uniref:Matrin-type domain-containing protein n=1 Tax=Parastrongyloides trichosuri TaxID=131310 RepID=A0A0N4ZID1_PARTI